MNGTETSQNALVQRENNDKIVDEEQKTTADNVNNVKEGSRSNDEGWTQLHFELPDDVDPGTIRVVYIDPDTGDPVESTLDEMPEGAKILKIDDEDSVLDDGSVAGTSRTISGRGASRTKKHKSVSFDIQQQTKRTTTKPRGPNFQNERNQRIRGADGKMYVVPTEDPYLQGNIIPRGQDKDHNLSPLTIFALARSRKENVARQQRRQQRQQQKRGNYSVYKIDKNQISLSQEDDSDMLSISGDGSSHGGTSVVRSIVSTDERLKNTKDDVMKWCLNAFKKTSKQIYFPAKPVRPGSTQSVVKSTSLDDKNDKQESKENEEGMSTTCLPLKWFLSFQ